MARGDAVDLDLPADSFDLVLCQQGLQFFDDPSAALRESRRVLVDGGRLALSVWQPLHRHPVYSAILRAEADELDAELNAVARPFTFGDASRLSALLADAGFGEVEVVEHTLEVVFQEPETFVALTVLAGAAVIPEFAEEDPETRRDTTAAVARRSENALRAHRDGDRLRFPMPNYLAVARA